MQNMQLIITFFALLSGIAGVQVAKIKGYHPLIGFLIGGLFGFLGVLLFFLFSKGAKRKQQPPSQPLSPTKPPIKNDLWFKFWYYLDSKHSQQGPFELQELINCWKKSEISEHSFIWGEGMEEWKPLRELPDLLQELN